MNQLKAVIAGLSHSDDGQDLLEYGLLACLIAVVVMAGVSAVGNTIFNVFWSQISSAL